MLIIVVIVGTFEVGASRTLWIVAPKRIVSDIDFPRMGVIFLEKLVSLYTDIGSASVLNQDLIVLNFLGSMVDAKDVRAS